MSGIGIINEIKALPIWLKVIGIFVLLSIGMDLIYSIELIAYPYQLTPREGTPMTILQKLDQGRNPYLFEDRPQTFYMYGFLYPFLSYPLTLVFGLDIRVLRFVSWAFYLATTLLGMKILRDEKKDWFWVVLFAAIFLTRMVYSNHTHAYPNSLGGFLFFLGLYIPFKKGFGLKASLLGIALLFISYWAKQYFLLGIPILVGYVFLFESKKTGIILGIISLGLYALFQLTITKLFPSYLLDTQWSFDNVVTWFNARPPHWEYLFQQYRYVTLYSFLLLIPVFAFLFFLLKPFDKIPSINWRPNKPMIEYQGRWVYPFWTFFVVILVFTSYLGFNPGASQGSYIFDYLWFPFTLILCLVAGDKRLTSLQLQLFLLLIIIFLFIKKTPLLLVEREKALDIHYVKFEEDQKIYNTADMVSQMVQSGKEIWIPGHFGFKNGLREGRKKRHIYLGIEARYKKELHEKIRGGYFDAILINRGNNNQFAYITKSLLEERYTKIERTIINQGYPVRLDLELWRRQDQENN